MLKIITKPFILLSFFLIVSSLLFGNYNTNLLRNISQTNINETTIKKNENLEDEINLPISDFSTSKTNIYEGASISFYDFSSDNPTNWSWTFPGGTPSTSNIQNPTVTYNTSGIYDVILTVTNSQGGDTKTKVGYITVLEANEDCIFLKNVLDEESFSQYTTESNNYKSGHNSQLNLTEFAEYYSNNGNNYMTGVDIYTVIAENNSSNAIITIQVWDVNNNMPGTVLYSEDIEISILSSNNYNYISFSTPILVPNEFFIGFKVYYDNPRDNFACYQVTDRGISSAIPNTMYVKQNNIWKDAGTLFNGMKSSLAIFPNMCPEPIDVNFSADATSGCDNLTVSFSNQNSTNIISWLWDFGDGNTSNIQNPLHTYDSTGTYSVSLTVSNGVRSITKTRTNYITVYKIPSVVTVTGGEEVNCGDNVIITASGGTNGIIYWQGTQSGGTNTNTISTIQNITTNGTYYFRAENNGCWGQEGSITIALNSIPQPVIISGGGTFCDNTTIIARGGEGGTIYWQEIRANGTSKINSSTSQLITQSGTYYFRAENQGCWGLEDSVHVIINYTPGNISILGAGTYCENTTITASGGNGGHIYWQGTISNGTNTTLQSNSQSVTQSGTYYFRANNKGCWGQESSVTVTINSTPQPIIISGAGTHCGNTTLIATGGEGGTIYWQNNIPNGTNIDNPINSKVITQSGVYYFRAMNQGCWTQEESATVIIKSIPGNINVVGSGTFCENTIISATGGEGGIIYWQGTQSNGINTTNSSSTQNITQSGTYYFRANNQGCWGSEGEITVTIISMPSAITILGEGTHCENTTLDVIGGNGGTIYWQGTQSNGINKLNPSVSQTITQSGTYYFREEKQGCWGNESYATVIINSIPEDIIIFGSGTFCTSTTLEATGGLGGIIYWQNTESGGTNTSTMSTSQTITQSGTYYFRAENNGCWGQQSAANVIINNVPDAITISGSGTFCENTTISATGGNGGTIYWQGITSNGTSTENTLTSQIITQSGTYYFRAENQGCWGQEGVATVNIIDKPEDITITGSGTYCTSTILVATGGENGIIYWQGTEYNGTNTNNNSTSQTITQSGTYYFRAENNGCWGNESHATVIINSIPNNIVITGGGTHCLSTTLIATGGNGGTIYWQGTTSNGTNIENPINSKVITQSGTYYFRAENQGCWGEQTSVNVIINSTPDNIDISGGGTYCTSTTLIATGGEGGTIYWQENIPNGTSMESPINSKIITQSGIYYFRAENQGCWGEQTSANVIINSVPEIVTVSGGGSFCTGTTLYATGGSGGTIYWQGTSTNGTSKENTSLFQTILQSGTYYFRAENNGCWGEQGYANVIINTIPDIVLVSGGGTYCNSATLEATGGNGGTIYWQGNLSNNTNTSDATSSKVITQSGTYYFRAENDGCWGEQGYANVVINSIPSVVSVSGGGTFCNNAILNATGGNNGIIYWQGNIQNGTNKENATISKTVTQSGIYYFRAENNGCWGEQGYVDVIINYAPSAVSVSGGGTFCNNTVLEATGGDGGTIYWQGNTSNGIDTELALTSKNITQSGIYYFRAENQGCWGEQAYANVIINTSPSSITISGDGIHCGNTILEATGGSGGIIYWQGTTSNGTSKNVPSFSQIITQSGTYYFRAENQGCWGEESAATVIINQIPEIVIVSNGGTHCGSTTLEATGGNGGTIYWQGNQDNGVNKDNPSSSQFITESGTYYFRAENQGCWGIEGIANVIINNIPEDITISDGGIFCGSTTIEATGGNGGTIYWQGTQIDGTSKEDPSSSKIISQSGTYYFRAENNDCWGEQNFVSVTIHNLPSVNLGDDIDECTDIITLDAGQGFDSYVWNEELGLQTYDVNISGTYTIVVTDENNCTASDNINVIIREPISISVSSTPEIGINANNGTASVDVENVSNPIILWSNGQNTTTITGLGTGMYSVTVSNSDGCSDNTNIYVTIVDPLIPEFSVNNTFGCDNLEALFTNESLGNQYELLWNFGDGEISNEQNPIHNYTTPGIYTVSLKITNEYEEKYIEKINLITIGETPIITYDIVNASSSYHYDGSITISINGGEAPYTIIWTGYPHITSETISYLRHGTYEVFVTEANGCSTSELINISYNIYADSETLEYSIFPNPAKDFINIICENNKAERIEILNTLGEILYQSTPLNDKIILNISNYTPGPYYIRIYHKDKITMQKILIQ